MSNAPVTYVVVPPYLCGLPGSASFMRLSVYISCYL